jgi:hypothetical protein
VVTPLLIISVLFERYSVNMVVLNRLITVSLGRFSSTEKAKDIESFFKDKDIRGFDRGLNQVQPSHLDLM